MNLDDLFDINLFNEMVVEKYVRVKLHPTEPLIIANYAEKTVYEKKWNEVTLNCRGLIYHADTGEIVSRCFVKFFNVGEYGPEFVWPNESVVVTDKLDGSLGILYRQPSDGQFAIATRGSFSSDQAIKATEILRTKHADFEPQPGYTYLYEVLYKSNRIVLDYGDTEDILLLAAIGNESGRVYGPTGVPEWTGEVTSTFGSCSFLDALAIPPRPNAEGIVIRFESGLMVKLKQESYVAQHAIVTNCTNRSIWECLSRGESLPEKASFMPDEFMSWMDKTALELECQAGSWLASACMYFDDLIFAIGREDRKTFAQAALRSPFSAAMFKLYDGQSIDSLAWKAVRPVEIVRPFAQREDSN